MIYLIALTLLLTPTYAIRFEFFGLPINILMLWVSVVWAVFGINLILKNRWWNFIYSIKRLDKKVFSLIIVFFLAGLVSLFWNGFSFAKLGQFIVLFLQPISLFFIAVFEWYRNPNSKNLLLTVCYLLLALMGAFSFIQYFTLIGLSPGFWGNSVEPKRALAFFLHPNFYALFSAPLLAFLIPDLATSIKYKVSCIKYLKIIAWLLGVIGLGLSLSRAGWLGLGIAGLIYLLVAADKTIKKISSAIVIVIVIIILSVPNLRWRFVLPFYGEKSAVSRISLWNTGWKTVKESPVLGMGLTGFAQNWDRLNTDPNIDTHNFPHNIFLNFWVETGIIGLISLIGLIGLIIYRGLIHRADALRLGVALFLTALMAQGLMDNPYFKNDLAVVFWMMLSMAI